MESNWLVERLKNTILVERQTNVQDDDYDKNGLIIERDENIIEN